MINLRKKVASASDRLRQRAKDVYHASRRGGGPPNAVLLIIGCQRSGTTALLRAMRRDWNTYAFLESSVLNVEPQSRRGLPRVHTKLTLRWRPFDEVAALIRRKRYPLVVTKPLPEMHRTRDLLDKIENAQCLWMFRHYRDVAASIVRTWPDDVHIRNLEPIVRRERGNWRSEFVSDDVRALIARHYGVDMSPHDGGALFWYARNRMLLDLQLDSDPRCMMLQYDDFASEPAACMRDVYEFVDARYPGPHLVRTIRATSIGRGSGVSLNGEVEAYCESLWNKLLGANAVDKVEGEQ